jgi:hypothetical protein
MRRRTLFAVNIKTRYWPTLAPTTPRTAVESGAQEVDLAGMEELLGGALRLFVSPAH